jgi:hypothetical protein
MRQSSFRKNFSPEELKKQSRYKSKFADTRVDENLNIWKYLIFFRYLTNLFGAPDMIRTRDPLITNQVLYQLSYKGSGGPIAQGIA